MGETVEAPDADLVIRARAGDRGAYTALYERYFTRIYDFSFQMVRGREDAADLVSEVFLKAMERLGDLKEPAAFRGWLYAITRNAALTLIEQRARTVAMPEREPPPPRAAQPPAEPSARVEEEELRTLVWEAAATLNPRDYSIFEMTVRQELDSGEVAQALGVKPSHAYVLVSRMKDTVEDALGAVIMSRVGRQDCRDLDAVVKELGDVRSPEVRRAVSRHLRTCEVCRANREKHVSAAALLRAVVAAAPLPGLRDRVAARIDERWASAVRERPPARREPPGRPPRRFRSKVLAALLALGVAGILLAGYVVLRPGTGDRKAGPVRPARPALVAVPDVIGLTLDDARRRVEDADLLVGKVERTHALQPEGEVLAQEPSPGLNVRTGSPVDLLVSSGPRMVKVPDVFHLPEEEARTRLDAAGLEAQARTKVMPVWGPGLVIRQRPPPGKRVPAGTRVTIVVCKRP